MASRCTDPTHGSVWAPDRSGTLRKYDGRRIFQYAQHPVTGRVVQVRHYKQLARLERLAERHGSTFDGRVVCSTSPAHGEAERVFGGEEAGDQRWVGSTNSEAMRGRRTPRRLGLIRSLATLKPDARAEAQVARRVSRPTASTVDWLHGELAKRAVSDLEIIERLGYETKLSLLSETAEQLGIRASKDPARCNQERLEVRTRAMLDRLVKLDFDAAELADLVIDPSQLPHGALYMNAGGVVGALHQRIVAGGDPVFRDLAKIPEARLARSDESVVFYASVLARTREHPVLSQLTPVRATFLATSSIEVDDRLPVATWELVADSIVSDYTNFVRTDGSHVGDEWHVAQALAVGGDPVKYCILIAALRSRSGRVSNDLRDRFPDAPGQGEVRRFVAELDVWREQIGTYGEYVAGKLEGIGRLEAVKAYGSLADAAWAHCLSSGLTFFEARAVAAAVVENPNALCRDAEDLVGRIRSVPLGSFVKSLGAAQRDHDQKHAGYDLSTDEVADQIVVDELGFRHRTRRRVRRGRREWHPSALDSATRLSLCFNKQWPRYLEASQRASKRAQNRVATIHELTYWLPNNDKASEFGDWILQKNRVQAIFTGRRGEIGLRRLGEEFQELTDEQRKTLSVEQAISFLRARGYGPLGFTPLGAVCADLDVPPAKLKDLAVRWAQAAGTATPLPVGKEWVDENSGLQARFLPRHDPRGLYLGHLTDCCQYPGAVGESCAWAGHENPLMGFFVVEDKAGLVLAQSWVWTDGNGGLCFDNVERKTSVADGWNANWGAGNEPAAAAVIKGLDWESMTPSQQRSWTIRSLYQRAAEDCTDRFDLVTMGVAMTKIPLAGWPRAGSGETLNPSGSGYTGYRDSGTQAVLARRGKKSSSTTIVAHQDGFAYRVESPGGAQSFLAAVSGSKVTVTSDEPDAFDRKVAAGVLHNLLDDMGPRDWAVCDQDGGALEDPTGKDWVIEGDDELGVPDVSAYYEAGDDIGSAGNLDIFVLEQLRGMGVSPDDPDVRALAELGFSGGIVELYRGGVRAEHVSNMPGELRDALDTHARNPAVIESVKDGSLVAAFHQHGELSFEQLHLVAIAGITPAVAVPLSVLISPPFGYRDAREHEAVKFARELIEAHGDTYVATLLELVRSTSSGGNDVARLLSFVETKNQKLDLDELAAVLTGGRTYKTARTLQARLSDSQDWTSDDLRYQFSKNCIPARHDQATGELLEAGIRASQFNALSTRVKEQFTNQATNQAARGAANLRRIVVGVERLGVRPQSLRNYPKTFGLESMADALDAGIAPGILDPELPSRLGPEVLKRVVASKYPVLAYQCARVTPDDAFDDLPEELKVRLQAVRADAAGITGASPEGEQVVNALVLAEADIAPEVANSFPSSHHVGQIIAHALKEDAPAAEVYQVLSTMTPLEADAFLAENDLTSEQVVAMQDASGQLIVPVALLAGADAQEMQFLQVVPRVSGSWRRYKVADLTRDEKVELSRRLLEVYRTAPNRDQLASLAQACSGIANSQVDLPMIKALAGSSLSANDFSSVRYEISKLRWLATSAHVRGHRDLVAGGRVVAAVEAVMVEVPKPGRRERSLRAALRSSDSVIQALELTGRMSELSMSEQEVQALVRCGLSRKQIRKTVAAARDRSGIEWMFEGTSAAVRSNSQTSQRVAQRAKILRAAKGMSADVGVAGRVAEQLDVVARRAVAIAKRVESDVVETVLAQPATAADQIEFLETGPTSDETARLVGGGLHGAAGVLEASRHGRLSLDQWDDVPTDNALLSSVVAAGFDPELVATVGPVNAVTLVERGVDAATLVPAVAGARTVGLDLEDFTVGDWELAVAGAELLASVEGDGVERVRAAALISGGVPPGAAVSLARELSVEMLSTPDAVGRLATMDAGRLRQLAGSDAVVFDDLDALETLVETDLDLREPLRALSESAGHKLSVRTAESALRREDGVAWVKKWTGASSVPERFWDEAETSRLTPQVAEAFYSVCSRFTPNEVASLRRAGVTPEIASSSDADAQTLRSASKLGLLGATLSGRTPTSDELVAAVKHRLDAQRVAELEAAGVGWDAVGRTGVLELIGRGTPVAEALAASLVVEQFAPKAAGAFTARITAFRKAGLRPADAGWYADCSSAQASRLAGAGCDGPTYAGYLAGDNVSQLRPADRYAQILRWVASGVEPSKAGHTDRRARHHVASLH